MSRAEVLRTAAALEESRTPHVLVTVAATRGSAPQDEGARLLAGSRGLLAGTVGGGKLEAAVLREAAALLAAGRDGTQWVEWDLKRDIRMTCGGRVTLLFEVVAARPWTVVLFGAGHVVQHLVPVLLPLPVRLQVVDSRPEWTARLPSAPHLEVRLDENPASLVSALPADAFVLCITQGHQTDLPILEAALRRGSFPFVGAIGSRSKATVLRRDLREAGLGEKAVRSLHCPLGLPLGSNHPHEIAVSIAAQLLLERDRLLSNDPAR